MTDFILAVYPIPIVAQLSCSRSTKISMCAVMAGGLLPFAAALGRTFELHILLDDNNATERWVIVYLWGVTEIWFVIILGSLPPLRAYFAQWFKLDERINLPETYRYTFSNQLPTQLEGQVASRGDTVSNGQIELLPTRSESFLDMHTEYHKTDLKGWNSDASRKDTLAHSYSEPST